MNPGCDVLRSAGNEAPINALLYACDPVKTPITTQQRTNAFYIQPSGSTTSFPSPSLTAILRMPLP